MAIGGGWVIEADIVSFFDRLDHGHLREYLDRRVRDGVIRRMTGKWLNAGVMEAGQLYHPETGSPQGGVVSPLLANIYLHEVLDTWFEREVKPRLQGRAQLIRYADDFVLILEHRSDAERVMEVLPKRFGKYGEEPPRAGDSQRSSMVQGELPPPNTRTTANPHAEATRALQLLRHHRQHPRAQRGLSGCTANLAILVEPSRWQATHDVAPLLGHPGSTSAGHPADRAQRSRCESIDLRSRMREIRTSGSVGAPPSNRRGYPSRAERADFGCGRCRRSGARDRT